MRPPLPAILRPPAAAILLAAACRPPAPARAAGDPPRVVAVGDLHGDLDNALAVLRMAGLVDEQGRWSGGRAVWVQTGDVVDRGPDSRALLALIDRLSAEAAAAGGQVVALLGNHEVMNLLGDWRYVHPGDVAAFGGPEARKAAFAPGGWPGDALRGRPLAARVGDTVFVHGGIDPAWAERGIDGINRLAHEVLAGRADPALLGEDSPIWYRGYVLDDVEAACPRLERALLRLDATRMVVGHTTRRDGRILVRCGGRLVDVDTGISDGYGGHLAALELRGGDDAWALTPAGPRDLPDPPPSAEGDGR